MDMPATNRRLYITLVFSTYLSPDTRGWDTLGVRRMGDIYIYILYIPRTCVRGLPFSFGKGSMAALKEAVREQERAQGSTREQHGSNTRAIREQGRARRDMPVSVPLPGGAQSIGA